MFTLEEKSKEWERRHPEYARKATPENEARYAAMSEQVAKMAELAEEAAMSELAAFGCIEPPFDTAGAEDWPDEWDGFEAFHAMTSDYFEVTGELCTDEVLGLA